VSIRHIFAPCILERQTSLRYLERRAEAGTLSEPTKTRLTTSKRKVHDDLMGRRLNTLVPLKSSTLQEVAAACSKALASPTRMRCLNPDCRRKIDRPAAGRLPLFCGRSCREAFDYERAELLADIAVLNRALKVGQGSHRERRTVQVELANKRWCLQRYVVPTDRTKPEVTFSDRQRAPAGSDRAHDL